MIAGGKLHDLPRDGPRRRRRRRALARRRPRRARAITDRVPLLGADGFETRTNQRVALARRSGLHVARIDHLLGRYGGLVDEVLELVDARPELAEPLAGRRGLPARPRSSTPSPTRAPATSTTC